MGRRTVWAMGVLVVGLTVASRPAAALTFQVSIDSSSLAGTPGKIAFDLTSPDPAQNSVTIFSLSTDATLGTPQTTGGQVTGGLFQNDPSGATMIPDVARGVGGVDVPEFYTSLVLNLTWGTRLSFTLDVTQNATPGASPDLFALYLLDPSTGLPLYATGDPLGTSALFAVSIDAAGACLFLPASTSVPAKLVVMNEISEPFNACIEGGLTLGKSKITFSKKRGKDAFALKASFTGGVALDPSAGGAVLALSRDGAEILSTTVPAVKGDRKKRRFRGHGRAGLKSIVLATKDKKTWTLQARGSKLDLTPINSGTNEMIGVHLETHTAAGASGISPAGSATFNGGGEFKRRKRTLTFP
jgi:hypothetical protein